MTRPDMICKICGSVLSAVTGQCVRGEYCTPPARGTMVCPICRRDTPHSHFNWDVERERFARPAFEKYFEAKLVHNHSGLDPAGTYGWALSWKDRKFDNSPDYWHRQVQVCWELWQQVYLVNELDHTNIPQAAKAELK